MYVLQCIVLKNNNFCEKKIEPAECIEPILAIVSVVQKQIRKVDKKEGARILRMDAPL